MEGVYEEHLLCIGEKMVGGVDANDFINFPLADWGTTLVRTPVTKSILSEGGEVLTDGSTNNITAIFVRKKTIWSQAKEALREDADAYIMYAPSTTVNKDDKIAAGGETFRVLDVIVRGLPGGTEIYRFSNLVLI